MAPVQTLSSPTELSQKSVQSKQRLTVRRETEGRRALCDLNAKCLASLLGLLKDQVRDDVYSRLEWRQLESQSHSHLEGCFKRLSVQEMCGT